MIRIEGIGELSRRLKPAAERVDRFDWQRIARDLDQQGNAMMEQLLSPEECRTIAGLYPNDDVFRSRIVMERHGFGRGEYKYFSYSPLTLDSVQLESSKNTLQFRHSKHYKVGTQFETQKCAALAVEHCNAMPVTLRSPES